MQIDLIAMMKSSDEFMSTYSDGDESRLFDGRSLLMCALANPSPPDRFVMASHLLDRGADATVISPDGNGTLHVLLGQVRQDIDQTAVLSSRLLAGGADINLPDPNRVRPIQEILAMKKSDDELAPLYDLWFARPGLELREKNAWGLSPLDLARKVPFRASAVTRMEEYLDDH